MSKMSQLHAALTEQAAELGFENIRQAEEAGFVVDYNTYTLVKDGWSAQDQAHEAWLKEKEEVLRILNDVQELITFWSDNKDHPDAKRLSKVTRFIEGVKYE